MLRYRRVLGLVSAFRLRRVHGLVNVVGRVLHSTRVPVLDGLVEGRVSILGLVSAFRLRRVLWRGRRRRRRIPFRFVVIRVLRHGRRRRRRIPFRFVVIRVFRRGRRRRRRIPFRFVVIRVFRRGRRRRRHIPFRRIFHLVPILYGALDRGLEGTIHRAFHSRQRGDSSQRNHLTRDTSHSPRRRHRNFERD